MIKPTYNNNASITIIDCHPQILQSTCNANVNAEKENVVLKPKLHSGGISAPILKWPGGKEKELKFILPNIPQFDRYFEPFVGGGSVFMNVESRELHINDLSSELMGLYKCIANQQSPFFDYVEAIDATWENSKSFFREHKSELLAIYENYCGGELDTTALKNKIHRFCEENSASVQVITGGLLQDYVCIFFQELEKNLCRKMQRMHELSIKKSALPPKDLEENIECAIKSALYMYYRYSYNEMATIAPNSEIHVALFFFIRNYAYSGMFRYSKGRFNVPYGGIAYNCKTMTKKLHYYRTSLLREHFSRTRFYNEDFRKFLEDAQPTKRDFIFLDPPYDSEFSTYANNLFTKSDQVRLADYLLHDCSAKWMMVIKATPFICDLYQQRGINIRSFEKEYLVSFMNRNDKKATHLLITNY